MVDARSVSFACVVGRGMVVVCWKGAMMADGVSVPARVDLAALHEAARLLVAAPVVWWCRFVGEVSSWVGCNHHPSADSPRHGCGWVALVPVSDVA